MYRVVRVIASVSSSRQIEKSKSLNQLGIGEVAIAVSDLFTTVDHTFYNQESGNGGGGWVGWGEGVGGGTINAN